MDEVRALSGETKFWKPKSVSQKLKSVTQKLKSVSATERPMDEVQALSGETQISKKYAGVEGRAPPNRLVCLSSYSRTHQPARTCNESKEEEEGPTRASKVLPRTASEQEEKAWPRRAPSQARRPSAAMWPVLPSLGHSFRETVLKR